MAVQFISTEEAAKKWNISLDRVIKGCETGQIKDAAVLMTVGLFPQIWINQSFDSSVKRKTSSLYQKSKVTKTAFI